MLKLSEEDGVLLRKLRSAGVLVEIEPHRLDADNGVMAMICSDCDQYGDLHDHLHEMCRGNLPRARIHPFAWHGGAITLSAHWGTPEEWKIFSHSIPKARQMKGLPSVVLYAHAPCGAARDVELSVQRQFEYLIEAKRRVRDVDPSINIFAFFHVDWGNGTKRTYFVQRAAWEQFVALQQAA